jgi:hypothetical protein
MLVFVSTMNVYVINQLQILQKLESQKPLHHQILHVMDHLQSVLTFNLVCQPDDDCMWLKHVADLN